MAEELYATLKTNHGDIEVKLFPDHAPKTVTNFTELAEGKREWVDPRTGQKSSDRLYDGTAAGWAAHGCRPDLADRLE